MSASPAANIPQPELDAHLRWQDVSWRIGTRGREACRYLPQTLLKQRFAEGHGSVLRALLLEQCGRDDTSLAHSISTEYAKVFATLLDIRRPKYISHFIRFSYTDDKIDTLTESHLPREETFCEHFCEERWKYCARPLKQNFSHAFSPKEILPFRFSDVAINSGGSAYIHTLKIDPDYDELSFPGTKAIKAYNTDASEEYKAEGTAYRNIGTPGRDRSWPGVLGFCGDYEQDGRLYCVLEYADKGNLEQFFEKKDAPSDVMHIFSFWCRLLGLCGALTKIHNAQGTRTVDGTLWGWHQDIKPTNILVCSSQSQHPNEDDDYQFKLGDFGNSHFKTIDQFKEPCDADTGGSRTFGAPETYRADLLIGTLTLEVTDKADIWSLGCVFAEGVEFITGGRAALRQFRTKREEETKAHLAFQDTGCFHDGKTRLRCIDDMLDNAEHRNARANDLITQRVIQLVRRMLGPLEGRPAARQLYAESLAIIKECEAKLVNLSGSNGTSSPHRARPPLPPGTPPTSPPVQHRRFMHASIDAPPPVTHFLSHLEGSSGTSSSHLLSRDPRSPHAEDPSQTAKILTSADGSRFGLGLEDVSPSLANGSAGSLFREHNRQVQEVYTTPPLSPDRTSAMDQSFNATALARSLDAVQLQQQDATAHGPSPGQRSKEKAPYSSPLDSSSSKTPFKDNVEPQLQARMDATASRHTTRSPGVAVRQLENIRRYSLRELINWYNDTIERRYKFKKLLAGFIVGPETYPEPGAGHLKLLTSLKGREHVFLVDDAVSMNPYARDVQLTVGALAKLIKHQNLDQNGVDLHFAVEKTRELKGKVHTTPLVDQIGAVLGKGFESSDLPSSLDELVRKYTGRLRPGHVANGLSIYVLTDGVWRTHSDACGTIRNFVRDLEYYRQTKNVGIQFIQFGNSEVGKARLEALDKLAKAENLARDIVDTEPFNDGEGNVYKIMLGMTDTTYDLENENENESSAQ